MAYLDLTTEFITEETLRFLEENTNITYLSTGSKARLILDIINNKLGEQAAQFDENVGQAFIRNANGVLLDYIGEIFGVERKLRKKAEVSSEERNFYFYTLENSFGDINAGQAFTIPVGGVEVYNTTSNDETQISYVNSEEIYFSPTERVVYFSAVSSGYGSDYNVGSNSLQYHDFNGYADSVNRTLQVNNSAAIVYAEDDETDTNYRFRIQQQTIGSEAGNTSSIRLNILSIAGVSDVVRIPYLRGIGTVDWLIKGLSPEVPERLISLCQSAIDEKQSSGMENYARAPITIGAQFIFSVTYRSRLEDSTKDQIKTTIRKNVISYVNNLDIGENLVIDQVLKVILNSDDRILSVGDVNSTSNFERINLYKRSNLSTSKIRTSIFKDYNTKQDERVIIEPTLIDPIVISDNN